MFRFYKITVQIFSRNTFSCWLILSLSIIKKLS